MKQFISVNDVKDVKKLIYKAIELKKILFFQKQLVIIKLLD